MGGTPSRHCTSHTQLRIITERTKAHRNQSAKTPDETAPTPNTLLSTDPNAGGTKWFKDSFSPPPTITGSSLSLCHELYKNWLFSRTPVGKKGAQRQKEGQTDCGPVEGRRAERSPAKREEPRNRTAKEAQGPHTQSCTVLGISDSCNRS